VTVAKHGNRAVTSSVGSADVIEALGIRADLSPADAARALREHGFAFFFAPNFHPAFKNIAPARKLCAERGQRTVFNFLGPLLNPARPSAMLVGVPRPELCEPMAHAVQSLGVRRGMVACGLADGKYLDELSTLGENTIAEFYQQRGFAVSTTTPENFPLQPATLADLRGGDKLANAQIIRRVLRGDERGPKRDAVLLNAAAALFVAGKTKSLAEGWDLAAKTIDGGQATAKLAELAR
jgi:anthranilate phosphoribosyltransferase